MRPEDFTVFSVNQTCVWTRFTDFQVPARMPPCPMGGCTCAFFWTHSQNSGSAENYMNGFKCNITGSTSQSAFLAAPKVPRRCGADPVNNKLQSALGNCTYGAKQPFYWFNQEGNNSHPQMFEGASTPPVYNDMYNFLDGAQDDIFEDSYSSLPDPSPVAPLPVLTETQANTSDSESECTMTPGGASSNFTAGSVGATHINYDRHWTPAAARRSRTRHLGNRQGPWRMF